MYLVPPAAPDRGQSSHYSLATAQVELLIILHTSHINGLDRLEIIGKVPLTDDDLPVCLYIIASDTKYYHSSACSNTHPLR